MARARWNDDWSDEDDAELPDEPALDDETSELIPCPECGVEIHEESQQCPACGALVTFPASPWSGRPIWWVVLGALGIGGAILAIVLGS